MTPSGRPLSPEDAKIADEIRAKTGQDPFKLQTAAMNAGYGPVSLSGLRKILIDTRQMKEGPVPIERPRDPKAPPMKVMDEVLVPDPYNADRMRSVARVGTERDIAAMKEAGQRTNDQRVASGFLMAAGGLRPGAASAGIVPPRGGAASGPPRIVDVQTGAHKPVPPPITLPPPGAQREMQGWQRELHVAKLTGGRPAREPVGRTPATDTKPADLKVRFTRPNGQGGAAPVDVIGGKGQLIAVGGAGKGEDVAKLSSRLHDLKLAAQQRGVPAEAYFTRDTPPEVLDRARAILGADNVKLFDDPALRLPPR